MVGMFIFLAGLALGSFVNALVWRVRELEKTASKKRKKALSPLTGRSMCVHCRHELAAKDLVPVLSWLSLGGKCRYCRKSISWHYPAVELFTACVFLGFYMWWPFLLTGMAWVVFGVWLAIVTLLIALALYDLKWMELPDKLTVLVTIFTVVFIGINYFAEQHAPSDIMASVAGGALLFSFFYILFQVSKEKWIGGGDVKLAPALGLLAGSPLKAMLLLFIASLIGTVIGVPLLMKRGRKRQLKLPFGPLLIVALFLVVLFGQGIIDWYSTEILYL